MLHDVEKIITQWETTGHLQHCQDRFNLALVLEIQKRMKNIPIGFRAMIYSAIVQHCISDPKLVGSLDYENHKDFCRLGPIPKGCTETIIKKLAMRLADLPYRKFYFAGIALQNNQLYLVGQKIM